jgi:ferritin-like metal-binding protein YciE
MPMRSLADLFHETLRDIYYAEKKLTKTLPKMAKKASNEDLSSAITDHLHETEGHVERLEQIFEMIEKPARAKKCLAMDGLIDEGEEFPTAAEDEATRDAAIIAAAQTVEHYEISRYGTLATWAELLGYAEAKDLLGQTLEEEKAADEKLTGLAEDINVDAEEAEEAAA